MNPAQEDIAGRLHQTLTGDDALAMVRELARAEGLLQHRRLRLLHLEEQGVLAVPAKQQRNPRPSADTPDTDYLAREIGQPELLEQRPPVAPERIPVAAEQPMQYLEQLIALVARRELLHRDDQRRLIHDPYIAVHRLGERGKSRHAVLGPSLRKRLLRSLDDFLLEMRREFLEHVLDFQTRVPHLQVPHSGELRHRCPIARDRVQDDPLLVFGAIAVVASGDQHAHGQPFDVPFPGSREGLVEIIEVEYEPAFG